MFVANDSVHFVLGHIGHICRFSTKTRRRMIGQTGQNLGISVRDKIQAIKSSGKSSEPYSSASAILAIRAIRNDVLKGSKPCSVIGVTDPPVVISVRDKIKAITAAGKGSKPSDFPVCVSIIDGIRSLTNTVIKGSKPCAVVPPTVNTHKVTVAPPTPPTVNTHKVPDSQKLELVKQLGKSNADNLGTVIVATPLADDDKDVELTRDQMAVAVARDMSGVKPLSEKDRIRYNRMLYDSIHDLVYQRASRYHTTCPDESVDDLAQECMYQLMRKLHGFDPKRGAFSTWSWHVCKATLNRKYRKGKRDRNVIVSGHFVNEDGESTLENNPKQLVEGVQTHECPGVLASEMMTAVRELVEKHPREKHLLLEIFGNPDSEDFVMPSYVCVSKSAKAVGMKYSQAQFFFKKVVRPFMWSKFMGGDNDNDIVD